MLLPGWAPQPGVFHAVYPTRRGMVPAVRRFLDFLREYTRGEGYPVASDPAALI
jgi:DNA-binding transcriptional LysR family regulator